MSSRSYFETRYSFDPGRARVWRAICEHIEAYVPASASLLELGSGYGDFINQIRAREKYALDLHAGSADALAEGIRFIEGSALSIPLPSGSVDVVFASNFLEHFDDRDLEALFVELRKVLARDGRLILLQPNYFYSFREYWDDYTHKKAFSHRSIVDFLRAQGFDVKTVEPRFIPFSFKSRLPKSYWLTRLYLALPYRPLAKQMLIVADRSADHVP